MYISVEMVGIIGLPIPLRVPHITSFIPQIKYVLDISNNFYNRNIDLCSILAKSGYAEDYIRAQFKKIMGTTPTEFLTRIRINHACFLIDTYRHSLSLSEIAKKCGYTDYVYFQEGLNK